LPTSYSWGPVGKRLTVPYEAPAGRRVNAIGAYFSHGPLAGKFEGESYVALPKSRAKVRRKPLGEQAAEHGVLPEEVGVLDSERFLGFGWRVSGRPPGAGSEWQRERPLTVVIDNYSVHKSDRVKQERPLLAAAGIELFYLPPYSPELSRIEPIWQDVKHRELTQRSYAQAGDLKRAVDHALARKAARLRAMRSQSDHS
jgi:hypothetical protein